MDLDLLVIGAGAAGIAAARAARAAGRSVRVLEARTRVGGRALTDGALGTPFDLGATWLHDADRNPLVPLARTAAVALRDSDAARQEVTFVGGRRITPAEDAAYDAAWAAFDAAIAARAAAPGPDIPAAEAAPRGGPWDATVSAWQGDVIAAWSLGGISLHDFAATLLGGRNLLPEGGFGALVARLAEGLPVTLGAPVATLRWGGRKAVAEGGFGTLRAHAAICTLPTALIAAGAIRFDPPLPADVVQAAADLPLGHAIKVGLRAAGGDRLGLPDGASTDRQVEPGGTLVPISFWPRGEKIASAWIGGPLAAAVARDGPGAAESLVRAEIAARLGHAAPAAFRPGALVSGWTTDPLARGAYSHARVGAAEARARLAAPLAGGRLVFAGEACHPTLASTVGGAWLSGEAAARATIGAAA